MEAKRRPGVARNDDRDTDSGDSYLHKSDRSRSAGAGQGIFTDWGPVSEKRVEASEEIMNTRKVAPLKGTRRQLTPVANPFANISNPFASTNQASLDTSQNAQPNASGALFTAPNFGNSSTSTTFSGGSNTFQFGATQSNNSQSNQNTPFFFGQQPNSTPSSTFSFGQQNPSSSFSFGQQANKPSSSPSFGGLQSTSASFPSTEAPLPPPQQQQQQQQQQSNPIFSFGQTQSTQSGFSFGQDKSKDPTTQSSDNSRSASPSLFTFGQNQQATSTDASQRNNIFNFGQQQSASDPPSRQSQSPSNIFGTPKPDGPPPNNSTPNIFSQAPASDTSNTSIFSNVPKPSTSNNIFGFSQEQPSSQPGSLFTSQINQNKPETPVTAANESKGPSTAHSPTKSSIHADDNDTIMNSPPKAAGANKFSFGNLGAQANPSSLFPKFDSNDTTPRIISEPKSTAFEPPKFPALTYESGPFRNPFTSTSKTSDSESSTAAQKSLFVPQLNSESKQITPPAFQLSTTSNAADSQKDQAISSSGIETENSTSQQENGDLTPKPDRREGKRSRISREEYRTKFSDCELQFKMLNDGFRQRIATIDSTKDISPLAFVYILKARGLTNQMRSLNRKYRADDKNPRKKAKTSVEPQDNRQESPGKSKTSNLFASIIEKDSTASNPSQTPSLFVTSSSDADAPEDESFTSTLMPGRLTRPKLPVPNADSSAQQISNTVVDNPSPPKDLSSLQNATHSSSNTTMGITDKPAAKSMFDRITPADKTSSSYENPFSNLGQDKAGDQTWKTDGPIKFGSSQPSPSFLFPGANHASPGTSRATTPGTADGGLTSEAESVASNAGETDGTDANGEGESPQAQVDLTAEDPKQQILFETEKVRASIRDTSTQSWEMRGLGPLRILKHEDTGSVTILMRLSPSGKILFHSTLMKELVYKATGNAAVIPIAGEAGKLSTWYIRFKTRDLAETFVDKCEELKST